MQTFKVNKNIEIVCQSESTRYGFRHLATLLYDGREVDKAKTCYLNQTWERYTFESVLEKLADKTTELSDKEKKLFSKKIKNQFRKDDPDMKALKTVSMVMAMGNLLAGDSQKSKNDWKLRMMKAGLENKGLIMPEDWDSLDEETKEVRLNGVIAALG